MKKKGGILKGTTLTMTISSVDDLEKSLPDQDTALTPGDQQWLIDVLGRLSSHKSMDELRNRINLLLEKHGRAPKQ
jgi:hypothetical protein